jgi:hypothetical protein
MSSHHRRRCPSAAAEHAVAAMSPPKTAITIIGLKACNQSNATSCEVIGMRAAMYMLWEAAAGARR